MRTNKKQKRIYCMYKLIIVEDESAIRQGLIEQIHWEEYGFEIVGSAANGRTALDMIPQLNPDAMLIDIMMPIMTGLELLAEVNREYPHIKTVVLSGYSEFAYVQKGLEYGITSYLLKPTKDEEIRRVFLGLRETLDCIHINNQKTERIAQKARAGEPLLLDHLLRRLITLDVTPDEWHEALETGLLPDDADTYGIAVFQANLAEEADRYLLNSLYSSMALTRWIRENASNPAGKPAMYPLINDNGTMTIFIITKQEHQTKQRVLLDRLARWIEVSILHQCSVQIIVTVGLGEFFSNPDGLSQSCYEAKKALEGSFFSGLGHVLQWQNGQDALKESEQLMQIVNSYDLSEKIANHVLSGQVESALAAIDEYGSLIAKARQIDLEVLLLKVMEILLLLSHKLAGLGLDISPVYSRSMHQAIRRIIYEKTLDHLLVKLKNICLQVVKIIFGDHRNNTLSPIIEKARQVINEHYDQKLTLEDMCKLTFLSSSHFSALFKQYTGLSFINYLTRIRIEKARELLLQPHYKIYEIAALVGYDDFRHFSKTFRKLEGINPRQFREKNMHQSRSDYEENLA